MKTLMIGLGTLVLAALTRPALAQRCLSFRAPAFFAGAAVAPGYPYPAYGYPVLPVPPSSGSEPRLGPWRHLRARVCRARRGQHQLHVLRPRQLGVVGHAPPRPRPPLAESDCIPEPLGEIEAATRHTAGAADDPIQPRAWLGTRVLAAVGRAVRPPLSGSERALNASSGGES